MPLAPCPDCGNPVASSALACPKCGRPTEHARSGAVSTPAGSRKFWKGLQLFGGLVLLLGFLSCLAVFGESNAGTRQEFANNGVGAFLIGLGLWFVGKVGHWWTTN